ncbi:NADPH:quinone oxidoreductase family protein [Belnapia sp. T6]|uniref:NADPH:quinone oxidoreductase family protein n=1 Tax=Belnapia mucosa TaxID=2804532 RepID=A0ABS1V3Q7_9PROT|nr:NADPH:quinone oxidoreductase family protein [Belnapia mucosa]MBL6456328.1 NADPH:quinone oxidoreductase family protein [Belnapia mucosa]
MRAILCRRHGDYRDMQVEEVAAPVPGPGEVSIAVQAAGVSFANILAIAGQHQNRAEPPFIPGTEVAGTVLACGTGVTGLAPGQRVMAALPRGGFAEQAVARAEVTCAIPDSLGFAAATLFPTIYGTAYTALVAEARLEAGETLLVHGAAGASGLAAVQLGRALGARVIACASTPEKCRAALDAGAAHAVAPGEFREEVLALTGGRGVDVVFDPVGGAAFTQSLRCMAPEARLLAIGFASGEIPQVPANLLLVKNIAVIGVYWGYYTGWARQPPSARARRRVAEGFAALFRLFEEERIAPLVQAEFPFDRFAEALGIVEGRAAIGKVVLTP